jgi:hypothetical protein
VQEVPQVQRPRIGVVSRVAVVRHTGASRVVCIPLVVLEEAVGVHELAKVAPADGGFTVELLPEGTPTPPLGGTEERRSQAVRRLGVEKTLRTVTLPAQVAETMPEGANAVEWDSVDGATLRARWVAAESNRPWAERRKR